MQLEAARANRKLAEVVLAVHGEQAHQQQHAHQHHPNSSSGSGAAVRESIDSSFLSPIGSAQE